LPNFLVALVDENNIIVGSDSSSKITVRVDLDYSKNDTNAEFHPPTLTGNLMFLVTFGVVNISGLSFTGAPGS